MPQRMTERGRFKKPEFFRGNKVDFPNSQTEKSSKKFVKSLKSLKVSATWRRVGAARRDAKRCDPMWSVGIPLCPEGAISGGVVETVLTR
jgi:ribosome biogenesis protein Nip4